MRGSKREIKRGVCELRVSLGKDPVTDKYKVRSKNFHGSARAADEALRDLVAAWLRHFVDQHSTVREKCAPLPAEEADEVATPTQGLFDLDLGHQEYWSTGFLLYLVDHGLRESRKAHEEPNDARRNWLQPSEERIDVVNVCRVLLPLGFDEIDLLSPCGKKIDLPRG